MQCGKRRKWMDAEAFRVVSWKMALVAQGLSLSLLHGRAAGAGHRLDEPRDGHHGRGLPGPSGRG